MGIYKQALFLSFFLFFCCLILSLKISRSIASTNAWPPANVCLHTTTILDLSAYRGKKEPNIHNRIAESLFRSLGTHPWTSQSKNELIVFFLFLL